MENLPSSNSSLIFCGGNSSHADGSPVDQPGFKQGRKQASIPDYVNPFKAENDPLWRNLNTPRTRCSGAVVVERTPNLRGLEMQLSRHLTPSYVSRPNQCRHRQIISLTEETTVPKCAHLSLKG